MFFSKKYQIGLLVTAEWVIMTTCIVEKKHTYFQNLKNLKISKIQIFLYKFIKWLSVPMWAVILCFNSMFYLFYRIHNSTPAHFLSVEICEERSHIRACRWFILHFSNEFIILTESTVVILAKILVTNVPSNLFFQKFESRPATYPKKSS